MAVLRRATNLALLVFLLLTAIRAAFVGAVVTVTHSGLERPAGLLMTVAALLLVVIAVDGIVLHGRIAARVGQARLLAALAISGAGALLFGLLVDVEIAGAIAGLLLVPAGAFVLVSLFSGTLFDRPGASGSDAGRSDARAAPARAPDKARQRRGGRKRS